MNREQTKALLEKYSQGLASQEEKALLENWYMQKSDQLVLEDGDIDFQKIDAELRASTFQYAGIGSESPVRPARSFRMWPRIAVAAAAVAVVAFGVYLFNSKGEGSAPPQDWSVLKNDLAPGRNGATITLSNGQVIPLDSSRSGVLIQGDLVSYADGTAVADSSTAGIKGGERNGARLMASTAKGQTYQFTLADGTKVWLNADSRITFPAQFKGKERKIWLDGEGYFEVAKDQAHPFIVGTAASGLHGSQEVKVLGTHFNINSYAEEKVVRTTLLEGSVEVSVPPPVAPPGIQAVPGIRQILKPDQQSQFADGRIRIAPVEGADEIAWKDGQFVFNSEPLESVMHKVARWYGVKVIYQDDLRDKKFSGVVSRFDRISVLLRMLETTGRIHFELKENTLIINKVN